MQPPVFNSSPIGGGALSPMQPVQQQMTQQGLMQPAQRQQPQPLMPSLPMNVQHPVANPASAPKPPGQQPQANPMQGLTQLAQGLTKGVQGLQKANGVFGPSQGQTASATPPSPFSQGLGQGQPQNLPQPGLTPGSGMDNGLHRPMVAPQGNPSLGDSATSFAQPAQPAMTGTMVDPSSMGGLNAFANPMGSMSTFGFGSGNFGDIGQAGLLAPTMPAAPDMGFSGGFDFGGFGGFGLL
ncbi:hypothetical protein FF100_22100 [Methylobacterium terricola]|uniref:Uncharacterized protein n=1 Tax=Methylobacterium terricola TaxID=2583531 RepID=A0A5C4LE70_9HYPH|nr:hypothetical protein [Methylobacterium terricola]TNC10846.1 hypothetical protein FF100_22100 [Methylobacterium terricola]